MIEPFCTGPFRKERTGAASILQVNFWEWGSHIRFILLSISFLLATSLPLIAQSDTTKREEIDSTSRVSTDTAVVTVTAERLLPRIAESARPTTIITREQIEESGARDLADAVAYAPGVFVKRYGGLGGLRTVSLRGTAPQQTILLIDGVRYQSSAESGFDFGNIPSEALGSVEVVRGGDAALYGANSLGGAINVVTGMGMPDGLRVRGIVAGGSFGERSVGLSSGGSATTEVGRTAWDASINRTESEGDYPFSFNEFGETTRVIRSNSDFTNTFARVAWSRHTTSGWNFGGTVQGYDTERGVPGAVVQGNREQLRARLDESDLFLVGRGERSLRSGAISLAGSGRINTLRYSDPDARLNGPNGIDNRYRRLDGGLTGRGIWMPDESSIVEGSLELEHTGLHGDNLDPSVGDDVARTRYGGAVRGSKLLREGFFGRELKGDAGVRLDLFNDIDPQVAPSLGLVWRPFSEPLRFRAHAALNYRTPSFSEQYYLNFGNTNLKAERSRSISGGITWQATSAVVVESSLFLIDTRDQIVAVPRTPVSWSAQNIGHVLSRGLELGATGSFFGDLLSVQASWTRMRAEDRSEGVTEGHLLPYTPEELCNGIVTLRRWNIAFSGSWEYVSYRHTLAYNTVESALPHYLVLNGGLSTTHRFGSFQLTGRVEAANIFDREYQVIRNYPMPGRSLRVELSVGWKNKAQG